MLGLKLNHVSKRGHCCLTRIASPVHGHWAIILPPQYLGGDKIHWYITTKVTWDNYACQTDFQLYQEPLLPHSINLVLIFLFWRIPVKPACIRPLQNNNEPYFPIHSWTCTLPIYYVHNFYFRLVLTISVMYVQSSANRWYDIYIPLWFHSSVNQ